MNPEPGDAYDAVIPLSDNQFENLLRAKRAMYGNEADDVSNAHVISLLALQEINRIRGESRKKRWRRG